MTAKVSKKNSFSTLSYQVLWLGSGIRLPRTIPLGPKYDFFTSVEFHPEGFDQHRDIDDEGLPKDGKKYVDGLGLLAACFGAVPGHPFIKECMDYFGSRHYIHPDGTLEEDLINPGVMALLLIKYGFRFFDKTQYLDNNMAVFKSNVFAGDPLTRDENSYAMHFMDKSWVKKNWKWLLKSYFLSHFPSIFRR